MNRSLARILWLTGILVTSGLNFSETQPKAETIRGRIVAYSNVKVCVDGNALWDMIVKIQDPSQKSASEFILVLFSLPCGEAPNWPRDKASSFQVFRLIREGKLDSILREFMDCKHEQPPTNCQVPRWKRVRGVEDEELPFGQRLPSYRSVGVPLNRNELM